MAFLESYLLDWAILEVQFSLNQQLQNRPISNFNHWLQNCIMQNLPFYSEVLLRWFDVNVLFFGVLTPRILDVRFSENVSLCFSRFSDCRTVISVTLYMKHSSCSTNHQYISKFSITHSTFLSERLSLGDQSHTVSEHSFMFWYNVLMTVHIQGVN